MQLDREQTQVVDGSLDKHQLIIAGPGSGKTRTLTERVRHLVSEGISQERIRVITFTRAATAEFKQRLENEYRLTDVPVSTIHSLARHILKKSNAYELDVLGGTDKNGVPVPSDAPKKALSEAMIRIHKEDVGSRYLAKKRIQQMNKSAEYKYAMQLEQYIGYRQGRIYCESMIPDYAGAYQFDAGYTDYLLGDVTEKLEIDLWEHFESVKKAYGDILVKEMGILDYTLQQIYAHKVLEDGFDASRYYDILMIDEFQDVDPIQFMIAKHLCKGDCRLTAVGDPDQSIYSFRGGSSVFIDDFDRHYIPLDVFNITSNYRSNQRIVDASFLAVEDTPSRYRKCLTAHHTRGIGVSIEPSIDFASVDASQKTAFLAYRNKSCRIWMDTLFRYGVPCKTSDDFGTRSNIGKAIYTLIFETRRLATDFLKDTLFSEDLCKYAEKHVAGIGKKTVESFQGRSVSDILSSDKMRHFKSFLENWSQQETYPVDLLLTSPVFTGAVLGTTLKDAKYRFVDGDEYVMTDKGDRLCKLIEKNKIDFSMAYADFTESLPISTLTVHKAKGLEYKKVYVDYDDITIAKTDMEQLLFVALSRAEESLTIVGDLPMKYHEFVRNAPAPIPPGYKKTDWHSDPYYSENAIRQRLQKTRQNLIDAGALPNEARKPPMELP